MAVTLRTLIADPDFRLRLLVPPPRSSQLDARIAWVHSSDLADPAPWLEEGQLLLTDGDYFRMNTSTEAALAYVRRLHGAGLRGLGFAIGILHDEVPKELISACRSLGLPLIEVANKTPFIAIIRMVADDIALDQRKRVEWTLAAQRAIARAALRPDGRRAILNELERQLSCWVIMYDPTGSREFESSTLSAPTEVMNDVDAAAMAALDRGSRSAARLTIAGNDITLQTLGHHGELRGVLAVGTAAVANTAEHDVLTSFIALASTAVEQSRAVEAAQEAVRSGVLALLLSGGVEAAERSIRPLTNGLPREPVRVVLVEAGVGYARLKAELSVLYRNGRRELFFAEHGPYLVVIISNGQLHSLAERIDSHRLRAGASTPGALAHVSAALTQARRALMTSDAGHLALFDRIGDGRLFGILKTTGGQELANSLLKPILDLPTEEREAHLHVCRVWLKNNGAWDPASKQLGIHRHTLRARIKVVEECLQLDLTQFDDRAELWTAIRLMDLADQEGK